MPFYTAGVPVLFFFTGAHIDYHRGSDDVDRINAAGGAQIAGLVARVAESMAARAEPLSYQRAPLPAAAGDVRASGGSLGTVPAYGEEGGKPGVLLADVRAGGPADQAGVRGGDRVVSIDGVELRSVADLMFVLRQATPGQKAVIKVVRAGKLLELEAVYGAPGSRMGR
jgi:S1-C subfamily serine protease